MASSVEATILYSHVEIKGSFRGSCSGINQSLNKSVQINQIRNKSKFKIEPVDATVQVQDADFTEEISGVHLRQDLPRLAAARHIRRAQVFIGKSQHCARATNIRPFLLIRKLI